MKFKKIVEISQALAGKYPYEKRCKHFTFIYEKNKLISIGINSPKTHPKNLKFNYINKQNHKISEIIGTHSEMNAVIKLPPKNEFQNLTLINTRINRNGELDYCKPCNGCTDMIFRLGINKVFYVNKNKKFEILECLLKL